MEGLKGSCCCSPHTSGQTLKTTPLSTFRGWFERGVVFGKLCDKRWVWGWFDILARCFRAKAGLVWGRSYLVWTSAFITVDLTCLDGDGSFRANHESETIKTVGEYNFLGRPRGRPH
jgi:hypothetical protein